MISTTTPSLFNKDLEKENAGIIAKLEYRAKDIFPTNKYFVIFEAFNSTPEDLLTTQPQLSKAAPGGANCYCRSDSWCGSQVGSDLAVCLWNDAGSSCATTNGGCGFMDWFNCRGICCLGSNCAGN
jgi:hypothetical protein